MTVVNFIFNYSGILAVIFAWAFIVIFSLPVKYDRKKNGISQATYSNKFGKFVNSGLILSGVFLVLFAIRMFLTDKIGLVWGITYAVAGICLLLTGVVTLRKSVWWHSLLATTFFIFNLVGEFFISKQNLVFMPAFAQVGVIVVIVASLSHISLLWSDIKHTRKY